MTKRSVSVSDTEGFDVVFDGDELMQITQWRVVWTPRMSASGTMMSERLRRIVELAKQED